MKIKTNTNTKKLINIKIFSPIITKKNRSTDLERRY